MIELGTEIRTPVTHPETDIWTDDSALVPHARRPWMSAYLAHALSAPIHSPQCSEDRVGIDDTYLGAHCLAVGSSGSGKSMVFDTLIEKQLRVGCSAVIFEVKADSVTRWISRFAEIGLRPAQLTLMIPSLNAKPGWNPLVNSSSPENAVSALVSMLQKNSTYFGPRMVDVLSNAGLIVAGQRLSLFELLKFLTFEEYRDGVLKLKPRGMDPFTYEEARAYFENEFGCFSKSERTQAAAPIALRIREFLRSAYLRSVTCCQENTLDLARLWQEQHVVLIHLDEPALGSETSRLLAGMLTHSLFSTAMRVSGPTKVILALDELASLERFMGSIIDIVTVARSRSLRLMVATQHLNGLSEELRAALMANTAVQLFFRLGIVDQKLVASSFATSSEQSISRIVVSTPTLKKDQPLPYATWSHQVYDVFGNPLRSSPASWKSLTTTPGDKVVELIKAARRAGKGRLYVKCPITGVPIEMYQYSRQCPINSYSVTGPVPISFVVRFPKPKVVSVERASESDLSREWGRILLGLPIQHCAVRIAGRKPRVVRVDNVNPPKPSHDLQPYIAEAIRANCQSESQVTEGLARRIADVARISGRRMGTGGSDDGSIE